MFAGMLAKNITDFNVTAAYEGIYLQATEPNRPHVRRDGLADYIKNGYVNQFEELNVLNLFRLLYLSHVRFYYISFYYYYY